MLQDDMTLTPGAAMSAATCLPASALRAVMVTSAPAAAKQRAVSTPRPAVPPVQKG